MKKGIMKKLMASVLAAALIATSVDYSWALVSVAAGNTTVITDGQLVAENYADKLTKQEIAVLESPVINGTTHTVTRPTADDNLVAVDSDNKTIYAKSFTKDGYTWVAEQAAILVDGATKETVTLEAKDSKYDGVSYDASGTFAFNENGYQVKVVYKLYITVSEEAQWDLLNTPYYLADGINNMNAIKEAAKDMKTIIKYVAPELESYVDGSNPLQFTGRTKEIVESWLEQRDAYNDSELSNLLTVNGYNTATSKVNNIIQYGTAYKECAEGIYDDLSYLATSDAFKLADQMYDLGIIDTLEGTIEALEPAMTSQWKILESGDMVKTNLADGAFDTLVTAAFDNSSIHSSTDITIAEKILADTVELTCNVNRYDVVVTVNALVIDAANKEVSLKEFTATVNVASGEPAADVIEEAEKLEAEALNYWNSLNDGIYAINTANYERVTAGLTADTVTDNGTYKIAYSPKTFKITIDGKETNAKYGETITFAKADDPDQAYEYTDEAGKIHEQGTTYRVTGDAAFSRSLGKAKTEVRVYDIITSYYKLPKAEADILGTTIPKEMLPKEILDRLPTEEDINKFMDMKEE